MQYSKNNTSQKKKILELLLRVENEARQSQIFRPGLKCLIGVSGGQDSICLAMFLRSFQQKWNVKFDLVYCHHGWQKDSFYNVVQITKYAVFTETSSFVFLNTKQYSNF